MLLPGRSYFEWRWNVMKISLLTSIAIHPCRALCNIRTQTKCYRWDCELDGLDVESPKHRYSHSMCAYLNRNLPHCLNHSTQKCLAWPMWPPSKDAQRIWNSKNYHIKWLISISKFTEILPCWEIPGLCILCWHMIYGFGWISIVYWRIWIWVCPASGNERETASWVKVELIALCQTTSSRLINGQVHSTVNSQRETGPANWVERSWIGFHCWVARSREC